MLYMMEAVYDTTSKKWVITKGAPEEIGKAYYDNKTKKWILSNQTQEDQPQTTRQTSWFSSMLVHAIYGE